MAETKRKLFISYSHEDERWLAPLRKQLKVLEVAGVLDIFEDTLIEAGDKWYEKLEQEMLQSDVALLLITASFLNSHFIRTEELPRLLDKHKSGGAILYPLLLSDCPWQEVSWLSAYQLRPRNGRPVLSFKGAARDKCLADVAREIASLLRARDPQAKLEIETGKGTILPANTIIGEKAWTAKFTLDPLISSILSSGDGTWRTRVLLESIGPGPEVEVPTDARSNIAEGPILHDGLLEYKFQGEAPKEFVSPGLYRMVGFIEYVGSSGAIPPLSYFAEGPIIQILDS